MQKRSGRSCGKVPVRIITLSVCRSPDPSTASGSFCFVFVEFNGGSAKESDSSSDLLSSFFFFFFFASLFPSPPALSRYLLPLLVFVRKTVIFVLFCPCNSNCILRVVLPVQ